MAGFRRHTFQRTASMLPTRPPRWKWEYPNIFNVAPAALNTEDLMTGFKNLAGITINFPDITVWRIRIRVSARFTVTGAQANNGVLYAAYVDDTVQAATSPAANPYSQHYLYYSQQFASEQVMAGGATTAGPFDVYQDIDIKSHRKLRTIQDSLFFQIAATGVATITDYSIVGSVLLRLPS